MKYSLHTMVQQKSYNLDLTQYRPVYAPKDFLEVLLSLNGPNATNSR